MASSRLPSPQPRSDSVAGWWLRMMFAISPAAMAVRWACPACSAGDTHGCPRKNGRVLYQGGLAGLNSRYSVTGQDPLGDDPAPLVHHCLAADLAADRASLRV